jgi:hypothetical protein
MRREGEGWPSSLAMLRSQEEISRAELKSLSLLLRGFVAEREGREIWSGTMAHWQSPSSLAWWRAA